MVSAMVGPQYTKIFRRAKPGHAGDPGIVDKSGADLLAASRARPVITQYPATNEKYRMMKTIGDTSTFRLLLVEPDEDRAREMLVVLERMGLQVDHTRGHLKAMALTEDDAYHCLLVATQGLDISGLELCAMIRARENRRSSPPVNIILLGAEAELVSIFTSTHDVDDYIVGPWMDLELEWKVGRAMRSLRLCRELQEGRLLDEGTGLLTQEGLRIFLYEEVNRVGRRQGWFSLSVLSVPGLAGLRASYGEEWLAWFKNGIWSSLRRQLRNYDRLASMDEGFLCLISPDLDEEGTRALLGRLSGAIKEYQLQEGQDQALSIGLAARYLCVRVLGDYKQFGKTGDVLWQWLRDKMAEPMAEGVLGYTGTVALNIEYAPDSTRRP